jgi:adenylate cyclase
MGVSHLLARRLEEAVPKLLLAIQRDPTFPNPYRALAACYAHMGRLDEAREVIARLRAMPAKVMHDASFFRNPEQREFYLSGLRLALGEAEPALNRSPGPPLNRTSTKGRERDGE